MAYLLTESIVINNCLAKYQLLLLPMRVIFTVPHLILCLCKTPLDSFFCYSFFVMISLAVDATATSDFRVESKLLNSLFSICGIILICLLLLDVL